MPSVSLAESHLSAETYIPRPNLKIFHNIKFLEVALYRSSELESHLHRTNNTRNLLLVFNYRSCERRDIELAAARWLKT